MTRLVVQSCSPAMPVRPNQTLLIKLTERAYRHSQNSLPRFLGEG